MVIANRAVFDCFEIRILCNFSGSLDRTLLFQESLTFLGTMGTLSGQIIATSHDLTPNGGLISKGNALISGKPRLVKYYHLARLYSRRYFTPNHRKMISRSFRHPGMGYAYPKTQKNKEFMRKWNTTFLGETAHIFHASRFIIIIIIIIIITTSSSSRHHIDLTPCTLQ